MRIMGAEVALTEASAVQVALVSDMMATEVQLDAPSVTEVTLPSVENPVPVRVTTTPPESDVAAGVTALTVGVRKVKEEPLPAPPIAVVTTTGPAEGAVVVAAVQVIKVALTKTGAEQAIPPPRVMETMSADDRARVVPAKPTMVTVAPAKAGIEVGTTPVMLVASWRYVKSVLGMLVAPRDVTDTLRANPVPGGD